MSEDPLAPADQDLAALGSYAVQDGFLLDLIMLADSGISTSVGLLVNGMIVLGAVSPPSLAAGEVDAERRRIVGLSERPEEMSDDEWESARERFAEANRRALDRTEDARNRLERDVELYGGGEPIDEALAPAMLTRRLIGHRARPFLTLCDVQLVAPGNPGIARIAVLRVAVSQIGAWWVIRHDETGRASFPLFQVEEPDAG
ncbi:MAG: hypothetical protein QOE44_3074 [Solirubrobacteraceae bacterium]|nr:hypothetical protein [Solirubrobacteraceae bacterium]